ncbi:MAG: response regulator [Frankiales bacterium]|jgi:CheY-like chemotaxis protein|nr:response regulator [Frankiales bacterium]
MTQQPGQTAKILMVDDRPENLLALEAILHGLGHELVKVLSGEDALKALLTDEFALILLDVQMPGMDGFETATHIKQRERTRDIPILFLTAIDGEGHDAFRGYAAGAVDYLSKPFDPWVLRAKVGVFIELFERRRELAAQTEQLRRELAGYGAADLPGLANRAAEAVADVQRQADEAGLPVLSKAAAEANAAVEALAVALARAAGRNRS